MRILGIARGLPDEWVVPAFRAASAGGVKYLEITMNTPGASSQISKAREALSDNAFIGAGTVLNFKQAKEAVAAGAQFLVCPHTDPKIIQWSQEQEIPIYPGALTPTEVLRAWECGAEMVKIFPVSALGGAVYIKDLLGPFDGIKLLACGGVRPENYKAYREAGAAAIALGGSLFKPEWLTPAGIDSITAYARIFSADSR